MPKGSAINSYWEGYLITIGKVMEYELAQEYEPKTQTGICFACGWRRRLQRCHIEARVNGGSDDVSNLHLLCELCHNISEYLEGRDYWMWLKEQNMWSAMLQAAVAYKPKESLTMWKQLLKDSAVPRST